MFALMISAGQLSRWAPENSATHTAPPAGEKTKREKDVDEEDDAHIPTSSFTRHLRDLGSHQGPRNRGPNAIRRGPRVSSANEDEITELQCLRVLRLLTKERSISCSSQFADLLRTSRLLSNMSAALHPKTLASGRLCCSAAEFLSELIKTNASRVLQHIISSNVIDGIVRLHESLPRRNTVLTAAILAVFNSAATSVAEAKQRALNNGSYGSPLGGMGGSPFLSRLAASETSASGNGEGNPNAPDLALVEHILLHYSSYLGYFGVNVLRKLQRIKETGGEGGAGEESSAVTSYSEARALSGTEFQALLVEYGCAPTDGTPGAISVDTGTVLSSVPNFSDEATLPAEPREENDEENAESSDDDTDDAGQLQEQHSPMPRAVPTPHRLSGSKTPRDADIPDQGIASPLDEQTVPPPAQPLPEASASKDESAALPGTTVEHKVLSNKTSPTKLTAETSVRSPDREAVVVDVAAASPPALVRSSSVKLTVSPKQEPANAIAAETTENLQSAHLSKDAQHPDAIVEKVNGAPSPKRLRSESINEKDAHITSSKEGGSETDDTIPQ